MKCFEIKRDKEGLNCLNIINRKHEMFWNADAYSSYKYGKFINRKHEMFWNHSFQIA